jgi:hypothetical protein
MTSKKKFQVFVSSTFLDLKEERQAAVEAILMAGHIPAGMELFSAGDESQMKVIKRWISDSDVFLLILGGRYGSIEPTSGLSYIHLEYQEALSLQKPVFAVVIEHKYLEKRVRRFGTPVVETENPGKLKEFRAEVMARLVESWSDPRDIQLAIIKKLGELSTRVDLIGWVRGDSVIDTARVADELARLTRENSGLRQQLSERDALPQRYNGLTFTELHDLLSSEKLTLADPKSEEDVRFVQLVRKVAETDSEPRPTIAHALWMLRKSIVPGIEVALESPIILNVLRRFEYYGIVRSADIEDSSGYGDDFTEREVFEITEGGHQFILRLIIVVHQARAEREIGSSEAILDAPT